MEEKKDIIKFVTINQAVAMIDGLTEYRLRKLIKEGEVKTVKAGKKVIINQELLFKYLNGETEIFK